MAGVCLGYPAANPLSGSALQLPSCNLEIVPNRSPKIFGPRMNRVVPYRLCYFPEREDHWKLETQHMDHELMLHKLPVQMVLLVPVAMVWTLRNVMVLGCTSSRVRAHCARRSSLAAFLSK